MKQSLYQISSEMQELLNEITELGGELTPELEGKINSLDLVLKDKANSVCEYRQSLMDYETILEEKIEHLKTMRSQINNKVDRLEEYILNSMKRMDITKIESDLWSVSIRKPLK